MKNVLIVAGVVVLIIGTAWWRSGSDDEGVADAAGRPVVSDVSAADVEGVAEADPSQDAAAAVQTGEGDVVEPKVVVYYLHRTRRCAGCQVAENYTRQTVQEHFTPQLASGEIEYRPVDIERPENREFVAGFGPGAMGVFLEAVNKDSPPQRKALVNLWRMMGDYEQFSSHMRAEIAPLLNGGEPSADGPSGV